MTTKTPEARAIWSRELRDVMDAVLEPHSFRCNPDEGGKPDPDCGRCIAEAAIEELDGQARTIQAYRDANAISALEVTPSDAAIDRAARLMFSRSIGSLSTNQHAAEMREYDARPAEKKAYWRSMAKELLLCAAGLPMRGV
jgi:hypothetical protein